MTQHIPAATRRVLGVMVAVASAGAIAAATQRGYTPQDDLRGTYALDRARSDDALRVADQATRGLSPAQYDRVRDSLVRRLEAPAMLAIDRTGRTVNLASSKAPRSTFDVDGISHPETMPSGNRATVRAWFSGDGIAVSTNGNRGSDFTITMDPLDAGRTLRVTRRIDTDEISQPVESQSYYRRTSDVPEWSVYTGPVAPPPREPIVPDRAVLTGRLDVALGNRVSHQGDRFSLTVFEPAEFRGAVIEGRVSKINASGRPGRSDLFLDFDRIRMPDGRTSDFEGMLTGVRVPGGAAISIDTEGVVGPAETRPDAVQRTAIGAAVGAILGAVAGGGKGAAVGAAIGATAGAAGAVYVQGRDLYMPPGTDISVVSRMPR